MLNKIRVLKQKLKIRIRYRKQLRHLNRVLVLLKNIMRYSNNLAWNEKDYFSKLTIISIVKNIHRLQSILILCKKGLAKDTLPILRTLFEEFIDYKYMYEDNNRVMDYVNYDTYLKLKLARELEKYKYKDYIKKENLEERIKKLQDEWDRVAHNFETKKGDIHKRWNKKNLRETCRLVGLKEVYLYLFKYLSLFTHSTTASADNYLLGLDSKNNNVVFEIGVSSDFIDEVCLTSSSLMLDLLEMANKKYNLGIKKEINKISLELKNIKDTNKDHA